MMNKSEKFWDRLSKNYDKPENIIKAKNYQSIKHINKYINKNNILLDFGCATGTIAFALADKVNEIHGIDISSKMIQIAKTRANEHKIENAIFSQSTIFDEKLDKNSYNMILTFSILHLLENTEKIIQRINQLLKPGDFFVSLTPCLGEKKFLSMILSFIKIIGILPYIKSFKINELKQIISNNNFDIVESKCIDNNPLEYFIIAKKKS